MLLLGLCTSSANFSNPTVALTRSRKISLEVSGSPLRNSMTASSSSARANSGSRSTRATMVFLKSRVSAICYSLVFPSGSSLPGFIGVPEPDSPVDVRLLPFLGAAAQQNQYLLTFPGQINPVSWPPVNLVLTNATKPLHVRQIALLHARLCDSDLGSSDGVQAIEPVCIRAGTIFKQQLVDLIAHDQW